MIRINQIASRKVEVSWDTGKEYQYLKSLQDLIKSLNEVKDNE